MGRNKQAYMMYIQGIGLQYGDLDWNSFVAQALPGTASHTPHALPVLKTMLPMVNLRRVPGIGRLALTAACHALIEGGIPLPLAEENACDTGLFIGTGLGPAGNSFAFMDSILDDGPHLASPTHFSHSVQNAFCAFTSMALNIQGPAVTICQFGLSFAGALQAAADALYAGTLRYALVGAVEESSAAMHRVRSAASDAPLSTPSPDKDCAVFFLLSLDATHSIAALHGPDWSQGEPAGREGDPFPVQRPYTRHMASQALDVALCLPLLAESDHDRLCCRYAEPLFSMTAALTVGPRE